MELAHRSILMHAPITKVLMDNATMRKLWIWACAADSELSAMGEVSIEDGVLLVRPDVYLLKQEGTWGSTHLDMDALADLLADHMAAGKGTGRLKFWWHTHPNMSANFSYTDDDTIEKLSKLPGVSVTIASVFNTDGKTGWRLVVDGVSSDFSFKIPGPKPTKEEMAEVKPMIKQFVNKKTSLWGGFSGRYNRAKDEVLDKCEPEDCKFKPDHHGCNSVGHEPPAGAAIKKIVRKLTKEELTEDRYYGGADY